MSARKMRFNDETIEWTRPMLKRFKACYQEAVECDEESFRFDGNEFLVAYAKYLISYLETQL